MRTFYPYQPNEVKHRKRTTRAQLKVLEDVYKRDTKPNAALRKKLAGELEMTPRGVQVSPHSFDLLSDMVGLVRFFSYVPFVTDTPDDDVDEGNFGLWVVVMLLISSFRFVLHRFGFKTGQLLLHLTTHPARFN